MSAPVAPAFMNLPQCAQAIAAQGVERSRCGPNFHCLCTDPGFLILLQDMLQKACSPEDQDLTLAAAEQVCTSAIPSLNDSRQPEVVAAIVVMMVLAVTSVVLRLISRRLSAARFGADDALILVALVFTIGLNVLTIDGLHHGFATHMIRLKLNDITKFAKDDFATQIVFACSITSIKISILLFYRRIFPTKQFAFVSAAAGIVSIAWCLALISTVIFGCNPVSFFWDKTIVNDHCINENSLSYGVTAANIVTDLIVLALPIPCLWQLQMKRSRKMILCGIFLLGCFVCIAGIVRIPLLAQVKQYDVTWTIVNAGVWINVECNIGIVSACLPVMRPLVTQAPMRPQFTTSLLAFSKLFSLHSFRLSNSSNSNSINKGNDKIFTSAQRSPMAYQRRWPQDNSKIIGTEVMGLETYRSEAEGYRYGVAEDTVYRSATQGPSLGQTRSTWLDDTSLGQSLGLPFEFAFTQAE